MDEFLQRHADSVTGMLSGFDRLLCRGTLRFLATAKGLMGYLWLVQVLLKDFGDWAEQLTSQVRTASEQVAHDAGRPIIYLNNPSVRKEDVAWRVAREKGIADGLICVLSAVEPCWSYDIHRNRADKKLELVSRFRKCLHLYHYLMHPQLGFMHVRVQTWLPFTVKVCLNGRTWLARQMDQAGLSYVRRDNCFTAVSDPAKAQTLLDQQLTSDWPVLLEGLRRQASPGHERAFAALPVDYYWSVDQSEWASDVMFKNPAHLSALYPSLLRQGMSGLGSRDVMRFLGRKVPVQGGINGKFQGEVVTDLKQRPEGIRLKHRLNQNSIKMYDKQGSVLRVETTINDTRDFKVYRAIESRPQSKPAYRQLRKGVADLHRRADVSQASNQRYLQALAAMEHGQKLGELLNPLCRPVTWQGKRVRALQPMAPGDGALLQAIAQGELAINGLRNRDLRETLYGTSKDPKKVKRHSGQVTRQLRLLRAHGIIRKVPHTHRYVLTEKGRHVVTSVQLAKDADPQALAKAAA